MRLRLHNEQVTKLLDAVVFDLDGTLVDTEPMWDEVRRSLAVADGVAWPPEATTAMMGLSTPEWGAYLSERVGLHSDPEESVRRTIAALQRRYAEGLDPRPGALEAVSRMSALAPLAIASSSPKVLIETVLDALGITDRFSAIVSTEEVAAGKPAPDGYLEACARLGAEPSHSVAIEDSGTGIRSAVAAGMVVVAVPDAFTVARHEVVSLADVIVDSLVDLDAELVIDALSRRFPDQANGDLPSPSGVRSTT